MHLSGLHTKLSSEALSEGIVFYSSTFFYFIVLTFSHMEEIKIVVNVSTVDSIYGFDFSHITPKFASKPITAILRLPMCLWDKLHFWTDIHLMLFDWLKMNWSKVDYDLRIDSHNCFPTV